LLKRIFSGIMLVLLIISMLTLVFNIRPVRASGTIYIRANGAIDPSSAPISSSDNITYTFADNISDNIVVERNSIIIDGAQDSSYILNGSGAFYGIDMSGRTNVTIRNARVTGCVFGINLEFSTDCNVVQNNITGNSYCGIRLYNSSTNILGNSIWNNGEGIEIGISSNNLVHENSIVNSTNHGISIEYSSRYNNITQNSIVRSGGFGIYLGLLGNSSNYNNIIENNITGASEASEGLVLKSCSNNTVQGNIIRDNGVGVHLDYGSIFNNLCENRLANNSESIRVFRSSNSNIISQNNIAGNSTMNSTYGIYLFESASNSICENNITSTRVGMWLYYFSSNNTVMGNNITGNYEALSIMNYSDWNNIFQNNLTSNEYGIGDVYLSSNYNSICENNITFNNQWGIRVAWYSAENRIYHNNFINNTIQAITENASGNLWANGYPSGGNYWSNYDNKTDLFRGFGQDETGSDGIADHPFDIGFNNTDYYPLMGQFGSYTGVGSNVTVFPSNNVGLIFENVTAEGSTTVNVLSTPSSAPSGFKLEGQYYKIDTTANYTGKIKLRIIYNDTKMTLEEENSLQLAHWNETSGQWTDITTYVDTVNNVIYGEENHLSGHGVFSQLIDDIALKDVTLSKNIVCQGYCLRINVTVANVGDFAETFNVTLYAGAMMVTNLTFSSMPSNTFMTYTFIWNTTGFAKGNYTIKAVADTVINETNTEDNNFTGSWALISMVGDLTGKTANVWDFVPDDKVDGSDLIVVAKCFGSSPTTPPPTKWNANCDITNDNIVDGSDLIIVSRHYGEKDP
jgi:parallel beta-helix repeat protein